MATPTPTFNPIAEELNYELKSQYTGLSEDLKKYFDTKQDDFLKKAKSSHSQPDTYYKDRGEFLIDQQIENIDNYRNQIWDYLTTEYNNNTREKYLNSKSHTQNMKEIQRKKKELADLTDKYNNFKSKNTTNNRQREIVLYEYYRRNDQLFIMKVISVTLLVCLIITIMINRLLPYEFVFIEVHNINYFSIKNLFGCPSQIF
jgi:exonuclease VII large subunit